MAYMMPNQVKNTGPSRVYEGQSRRSNTQPSTLNSTQRNEPHLPGKSQQVLLPPLRLDRGESRGEESKSAATRNAKAPNDWQPLDQWEDKLWQHHELFEDAVK